MSTVVYKLSGKLSLKFRYRAELRALDESDGSTSTSGSVSASVPDSNPENPIPKAESTIELADPAEGLSPEDERILLAKNLPARFKRKVLQRSLFENSRDEPVFAAESTSAAEQAPFKVKDEPATEPEIVTVEKKKRGKKQKDVILPKRVSPRLQAAKRLEAEGDEEASLPPAGTGGSRKRARVDSDTAEVADHTLEPDSETRLPLTRTKRIRLYAVNPKEGIATVVVDFECPLTEGGPGQESKSMS